MPWYLISANHGPGHQSHSEFYRWYDEKLTKAEAKYEFEELFRDKEWPIGNVKLLKKLPVDVRKFRIEDIKSHLKDVQASSKKMLEILTKTPTGKCVHQRAKTVRGSIVGPASQCAFCGRVRLYGKKKWVVLKELLN